MPGLQAYARPPHGLPRRRRLLGVWSDVVILIFALIFWVFLDDNGGAVDLRHVIAIVLTLWWAARSLRSEARS